VKVCVTLGEGRAHLLDAAVAVCPASCSGIRGEVSMFFDKQFSQWKKAKEGDEEVYKGRRSDRNS
tara:strand:- start:303 stop:497 length:195 start_codon:yes stop_codon:yes gene_type:complete